MAMRVVIEADTLESPQRNVEMLKDILKLGHVVALRDFEYCKELGQLIFDSKIMDVGWLRGIEDGQMIVDKSGDTKVIKHQNTTHVFTTTDGAQVILGDFELKSPIIKE